MVPVQHTPLGREYYKWSVLLVVIGCLGLIIGQEFLKRNLNMYVNYERLAVPEALTRTRAQRFRLSKLGSRLHLPLEGPVALSWAAGSLV